MNVAQTYLRSNNEHLNHYEGHSRDHIVLDFIREQHPSLIPTSEITHHRISLPLYSGVKSLLDHLNNSRTDLLVIGITEEDRDYVIQNLTELKEFCRVKQIDYIVVGLNRKGEVASSALFTQDDNLKQSIRLENLAVRQLRFYNNHEPEKFCTINLKQRIKPTVLSAEEGTCLWNTSFVVDEQWVTNNNPPNATEKIKLNSTMVFLNGHGRFYNTDNPAFDFSNTVRNQLDEKVSDNLSSFEVTIASVRTKVHDLVPDNQITPLDQLEAMGQKLAVCKVNLADAASGAVTLEEQLPWGVSVKEWDENISAAKWEDQIVIATKELRKSVRHLISGGGLGYGRNIDQVKSNFAAVGGLIERYDIEQEKLSGIIAAATETFMASEVSKQALRLKGVRILFNGDYREIEFKEPILATHCPRHMAYVFEGSVLLKGLIQTTTSFHGPLMEDVCLTMLVIQTDDTVTINSSSLSREGSRLGKVENFIFA